MATPITPTPRVQVVIDHVAGNQLACVQGRIKVSDLIIQINDNLNSIEDIQGDIITINTGKIIKTRRDGNILYMTDNGTTP